MKQRFLVWFIPRIIYLIFHLLAKTIRWQVVGRQFVAGQTQHFVLSFWHARMLMMPHAFRGWLGYMLISEHRDGGFIADTMEMLGIKTVRGSSTRGGARAMLQMLRLVRDEQCDLGITPDGPKGPREVVSPGAVQIAQKANLPLLPACYATDRHKRAGSWDRFYLPYPFSNGVIVYGDLLTIGKDEPLESATARLQQAMNEVQQRADLFFD